MYGQDRSWAISELHIDALNHLLHVQTRSKEELKQAFEGFRYFSPDPKELLGPLSKRAFHASKDLHEFQRFQEERLRLRDMVRRTRIAAEKLHDAATYHMRSGDPELQDGFGETYVHSDHWIRFLRHLSLVLDDTSADRPRSWLCEKEEHWLDVAESLKVLINLKDEWFRSRRAKELAQERLRKESSHSLKPSKGDADAVRWEAMHDAYGALKPINRLLDTAGISFRLHADLLSRPHVLIEKVDCPTGIRPHGLLAGLFMPFIDYLCDPSPSLVLGVCSQLACEAVFDRQVRPGGPGSGLYFRIPEPESPRIPRSGIRSESQW